MTDEEILKRLAEIEGHIVTGEYYGGSLLVEPRGIYTKVDEGQYSVCIFNPLHDDAQCFALVKKHRIEITWDDPADGLIWGAEKAQRVGNGWGRAGFAEDPSLNRAICLAIIEANK